MEVAQEIVMRGCVNGCPLEYAYCLAGQFGLGSVSPVTAVGGDTL